MGIRETLNRNPLLVAAAVVVAAGVAGYMLFPRGNSQAAHQTIPGTPQAWYTTDDGKTWFHADANKLTPFDHEGKQAFRCHVWTCDDGKTQFVSHVERYKPSILKYYGDKGKVEPWDVPPGSVEVKRAQSSTGWVDASLPQAQAVLTPRCPSGNGVPQPVYAPQPQ